MAGLQLTAVPTSSSTSSSPTGEVYDLGREVETGAQRVARLQREVRSLAREQVDALARDLDAMALRAAEIAAGGEVYPAGARELASRIADDLPQKAQTLLSIMGRTAN
ncbi:MAG TPA: hypothetical protein VGI79_12520 [Caulobacteraceae bacterium]|jgi:hypothetical protein